MSSSKNHAKRSHRSETRKSAAYRSSATRNWYRQSVTATRRSIFSRLFTTRKTPAGKQNTKQANTDNNI